MTAVETTFKTAITASLTFCVALAWNSLFNRILASFRTDTVIGHLTYAVLLTAILSVVSNSFRNDKLSVPTMWNQ